MERFRWTRLLVIVVLVGAIISVACEGAQETSSPAVTATAAIPSPSQTAKPTAVSPTVVVPTTAPRPTAEPTQSPTVSDGSLRVLGSRAALVPTQLDPVRLGNVLLSPATQVGVGGEGGLTISVNGSVTVEADEAYIVVIPPPNFGLRGIPQGMTGEDRTEVIATLTKIGIAEDDIEFPSNFRFGPGSVSVSVEVAVKDLPEIGDLVLDAVEDVLGRSEASGVRFSLEDCDGALALARREAIPLAEAGADDLAQALRVNRGRVIAALEFPLNNFGPPELLLDRCSSQLDPYSLLPFDTAEPEIQVSVGLQITYAIE